VAAFVKITKQKKAHAQGEWEMDKATEQLYREREKRFIDAVQLRLPDRVPTSIHLSYLPARLAGITYRDAYYDFPKWKDAYLKTAVYFQPDRCEYFPNQSGKVIEALGSKTMLWPGHGLGINSSHQFVENEYMKAEEYDLFLNDQSDFNIRFLMPRSYSLLEPLSMLPPLESMQAFLPLHVMATPEFGNMLEKLAKISREGVEWQKQIQQLSMELNEAGFPGKTAMIGGGVPYDMISDFMRGMRGAMLDMYRCPDKLLAAIEKISQQTLRRIAAAPKPKEFTTAFIALHRGSDGFMSLEQFDKFYWPYLMKLVNALVDAGYTPEIFFEGDYTKRLEYLRQLPKGKVIARFDRSDMARVKEVLGGHACISGNVPASLLQMSDVAGVKEYCKWLIDVVGKDGGFIMGPGSVVDEVKPENLKAMIDFTREYGKY
jgi:uroporphyrinogen-III decarboxylase